MYIIAKTLIEMMSKAMKYGFELNDAKVAKFSVGRSFPAGRSFFPALELMLG
jgi:hypothetical protein